MWSNENILKQKGEEILLFKKKVNIKYYKCVEGNGQPRFRNVKPITKDEAMKW